MSRLLVSIHSGHCWPENPVGLHATEAGAVVSIHSGHCWPENHEYRSVEHPVAGFNPLRPLLAGESISTSSANYRSLFQSTPAIAGRRIPFSITSIA